jgi:hypothetical protein
MSQHQDRSLSNRKVDMRMRFRLASVVKQHPIITFFVLAYAFSWVLESPLVFLTDSVTDAQVLVLRILASNVPSVGAIVLSS